MAVVLTLAVLPVGAAQAAGSGVCSDVEPDVYLDVPRTNVHADNIDCVAALGITVGVGGRNYDPSGTVTRGQMASFLVNLVEVAGDARHPLPSEPSRFDDVAGTTHVASIRIADELRITSGQTATSYVPAGTVTRAQMATFVVQALKAAGADLGPVAPDRFSDDDGSVHETNIDLLAAAGVVTGTGERAYDPSGHVSRAQMATFLANAAGLLADQGLWRVPQDHEGPEAVLVVRAGAADDVIEVRWDQPITSTGVGDDYEVVDMQGTTLVASGTTVTAAAADVLHVTLDAPLVADMGYHLDIAADVAADADGTANDEQRLAFTFRTDDATGDGPGDGPGDPGDPDVEPAAPGIVAIATSPSTSTLEVTFDEPVTCPTSSAAAAAWSFANASVVESQTHANGSPDTVVQMDAPTTSCQLAYTTQGVENGDFGTMSYQRPDAVEDQVRTAAGGALQTMTGFKVTDSVAPTFEKVSAFEGSDVLLVRFSEPIACSTIAATEFSATVSGNPVTVTTHSCGGAAAKQATITIGSVYPTLGQEVTVTVVEGTTLSDQSLENRVLSGTRSTMPV